jgi:hypothetical protein
VPTTPSPTSAPETSTQTTAAPPTTA